MLDEKMMRRVRKIIRLHDGGDEDRYYDAYWRLCDSLSGGGRELFDLMVRTILQDAGAGDWPEHVIRMVVDFAWTRCRENGVDEIGTLADTVHFAMDMHDWNRIKEDQ